MNLHIPYCQRVHIKKEGLFDDPARHRVNRTFPKDLPGRSARAVMLFHPMMISD